MKKIIFVFFGLLMLVSCARKDGIYDADKGWDCVYQGQEYRYRIEPDGLYLYTSFDAGDGNRLTLYHEMKGISMSEDSHIYLKFFCVNKDNDYIYMESYEHMAINYQKPIKALIFDVGEDGHFGIFDKDHPSIKLLNKYLSNRY